MMERGFTAAIWTGVKVFTGRCAIAQDVDAGAAAFALGDTWKARWAGNAQAFEEPLPQPAIWYEAGEGAFEVEDEA